MPYAPCATPLRFPRLPVLWAALAALLLLCQCRADILPPTNAITDAGQLRQAIDARLEGVEDGRFRDVVFDYFGQGERVRGRQTILVGAPNLLRVQTRLPGSDELMSLLVSDGNSFALHERESNRYYTGAPTAENINRLLPVNLSAPDVVRILLGSAPWDRFGRESAPPQVGWNRRTGRYVYEVATAGGGRLRMEVRAQDFAVALVEEFGPKKERLYSYTTEDWKAAGVLALPAYRRFVWPERDLDFSLDVGNSELNVGLDPAIFEFAPPPGSEVIRVERD